MFENANFGNRGGSHQLLSSSLPATSSVLQPLRFLVDRPAGHVGPEVRWFPYWGCQRIEDWWVLWRGDEDKDAPRKNMVSARVVLLSVEECGSVDDIDELLAYLGHVPSGAMDANSSLSGPVVDWLARGEGPAIVADLSLAPYLIRAIWPRLWPTCAHRFRFAHCSVLNRWIPCQGQASFSFQAN